MSLFVVKQPRREANIEVVMLVNSYQQQQNIFFLSFYLFQISIYWKIYFKYCYIFTNFLSITIIMHIMANTFFSVTFDKTSC